MRSAAKLNIINDGIIRRVLHDLGLNTEVARADILSLSKIYIDEAGSSDIWKNPNHIAAYLYYFLPLNLVRIESVAREASRLGFFNEIQNVLEFGSGPGTAQIILNKFLKIKEWTCIEESKQAQKIHLQLAEILSLQKPNHIDLPRAIKSNALGVFSYSLCEGKSPDWLFQCDSILIIEPSTQNAGRELMRLRENLTRHGYYIWAPCTHQKSCPLLNQSKTDWCHMRQHWQAPDWFLEIEKNLPMKNQSLTFSYLLASRRPPETQAWTRVIGDTLYEKGKVRQAICRSDQREYLSWLTRDGDPTTIERGKRIRISDHAVKKSNEIRVTVDHPLIVED